MEKIVHYGCLFIYNKIHEQIPTKIIFLILLLNYNSDTNFCKLKMYSN